MKKKQIEDVKDVSFEIGERVKTLAVNMANLGMGRNGSGTITGIYYLNGTIGGRLMYQVREGQSHTNFNYDATGLRKLKTQTLYAYVDKDEEVHWSTRQYKDSELCEFQFKEAKEFNKSIDLE